MEPQPPVAAVSAADRKKLEKAEKAMAKNKQKFKLYVDYLLRHLTITTSKYIAWEKNEFELFKEAIEKAQRLDEKDANAAPNLKKLKLRCEILEAKKYFSECNMVNKYLDFIARMRGLNLIAKDLAKLIKKAKLEPLEELESQFTYWKDFVSPAFNVAGLQPIDVDKSHEGMKYVMWICLFRTLLYLGNKFLQSASTLTTLPLVAVDDYVAFNLSEDQLSLCERLESTFNGVSSGPAVPNLMSAMMGGGMGAKKETKDEQKVPGETEYLTFDLASAAEAVASAAAGKKGKKGKK